MESDKKQTDKYPTDWYLIRSVGFTALILLICLAQFCLTCLSNCAVTRQGVKLESNQTEREQEKQRKQAKDLEKKKREEEAAHAVQEQAPAGGDVEMVNLPRNERQGSDRNNQFQMHNDIHREVGALSGIGQSNIADKRFDDNDREDQRLIQQPNNDENEDAFDLDN